jgi:hypothetical protein
MFHFARFGPARLHPFVLAVLWGNLANRGGAYPGIIVSAFAAAHQSTAHPFRRKTPPKSTIRPEKKNVTELACPRTHFDGSRCRSVKLCRTNNRTMSSSTAQPSRQVRQPKATILPDGRTLKRPFHASGFHQPQRGSTPKPRVRSPRRPPPWVTVRWDIRTLKECYLRAMGRAAMSPICVHISGSRTRTAARRPCCSIPTGCRAFVIVYPGCAAKRRPWAVE